MDGIPDRAHGSGLGCLILCDWGVWSVHTRCSGLVIGSLVIRA